LYEHFEYFRVNFSNNTQNTWNGQFPPCPSYCSTYTCLPHI